MLRSVKKHKNADHEDKRSELSDSNVSSSTRKARTTRYRLKMRMVSSLGLSGMTSGNKGPAVTYENTYRTDPEDDRKFSQREAEQIIGSIFESYLTEREYDPKRFPSLSKTLSELIKERVKATGLARYKVVATVTLCENKAQGVRVASRCLWDPALDNHASLVFQGANFFAVGSVYAVYFE